MAIQLDEAYFEKLVAMTSPSIDENDIVCDIVGGRGYEVGTHGDAPQTQDVHEVLIYKGRLKRGGVKRVVSARAVVRRIHVVKFTRAPVVRWAEARLAE